MRIPPLRVPLLVCFVLFSFAAGAGADEIRLKNGDRLTGKVVTLEKGVLKFDTGHGLLEWPWADIVAATIDTPVIIKTTTPPPRTVPVLNLANGRVTADGVDVPAGEVVALTRPPKPLVLSGGANAGFLSTGGNTDVASLRLDGEWVARTPQNRYTLGGIVNHATDQGVDTTSNRTGTARYDRFFNPRFYANTSALLTNDRFRSLDLRTALGLGLGYQAADNTRLRLGIEGGYGYVREQFTIAPDDSYHALRDTVTLDVFALAKRVTFFHRHDGFFGVTGDDNLFVQSRTGVRFSLVAGLVATVQYDVDYDRSPSPGRATTDRALGVTFGYRF